MGNLRPASGSSTWGHAMAGRVQRPHERSTPSSPECTRIVPVLLPGSMRMENEMECGKLATGVGF